MKAKETGTSEMSGSIAMSEQRIRVLEELDFVWALRSTTIARRGRQSNIDYNRNKNNIEEF